METENAPWDTDDDVPELVSEEVDPGTEAATQPTVEQAQDTAEPAQETVAQADVGAPRDALVFGLEDLATSDHPFTRALEEREIALADYVVEPISRTLSGDEENGPYWLLEVYVFMEVRHPCSHCGPC